jgi:hypothetical protein
VCPKSLDLKCLNKKPFCLQLPVLKAMEKPEDYDIDKDMQGDEDVDESKIGEERKMIKR